MRTNKGKILRLKPQNDRVVKRDSSAKAFRMTKESGRSMVEMLGVLAVVGVLSIGGIMGYTYAMKKHRVNELLNEGNMRAVLYTAQVNIGNINEELSDFPSEAHLSGGIMYNGIVTDDDGLAVGQFGVEVTGVSQDVCEMLEESIGEKTPLRRLDPSGCESESNDFLMVYTNEMSSEAFAEDYGDKTECEAAGFNWCTAGSHADSCAADCCSGVDQCQTCNSATGAITNKVNATLCNYEGTGDGVCLDGVCEKSPLGEECSDNTVCGGVGSGFYCASTTGTGTSPGKGTCQEVKGHSVNTSYSTKEIWKSTEAGSSGKMNWWAAKNWCEAQDMNLIDISGTKLGCYTSTGMEQPFNIVDMSSTPVGYCCSSEYAGSCSTDKSKQSSKMQTLRDFVGGTFWTGTSYSSAVAYFVYVSGGYVNYTGRTGKYYAVCE